MERGRTTKGCCNGKVKWGSLKIKEHVILKAKLMFFSRSREWLTESNITGRLNKSKSKKEQRGGYWWHDSNNFSRVVEAKTWLERV